MLPRSGAVFKWKDHILSWVLAALPRSPHSGPGWGVCVTGYLPAEARATEPSQVLQKDAAKLSGRTISTCRPVNCGHTVTFPMCGCLVLGGHTAALAVCPSPHFLAVYTGERVCTQMGEGGSIHLRPDEVWWWTDEQTGGCPLR